MRKRPPVSAKTGGFTLVEVMVSMTLLSVGSLALARMLVTATRLAGAAAANSYQTAMVSAEVSRYDATPFDAAECGHDLYVDHQPVPGDQVYHHQQRVLQGEAGDRSGDSLGEPAAAPDHHLFHPLHFRQRKPVEDRMNRHALVRRGFTLVELLLSLIVTAIVGAALVRMVLGQAKFMDQQEAWRGARAVARGGVNRLVSDLRMVEATNGVSAAVAGGQDFTVADPLRLRGHMPGGRQHAHAEPAPG